MKIGLYLLNHLLYCSQWLDFKCDATESVFLIKMIVIRNFAYQRDAHPFQCCALNFNSITTTLGLHLLEHLLYRIKWSDIKSDHAESVYSMKNIMFCYLDHPRVAHLFQCSVSNLNSISMKLGLDILEHLLYRTQKFELKLWTQHWKKWASWRDTRGWAKYRIMNIL
jgi:hypothetical protein